MKLLPGMHRSGKRPQWEDVAPENRNKWQIRAAQTHGIDTPGNRETLKGIAATSAGIYCVKKGYITVGTLLIGWGRWKDINDGRIAEATGTKSPLGEVLDAVSDNVLVAEALPAFKEQGILSPSETIALEGVIAAKFIGAGASKLRSREDHASRLAKIGMFGTWAGMGLRLMARSANELGLEQMAPPIEKVSNVILRTGIGMCAVASAGYLRTGLGAESGSQPAVSQL